MDGSAAKRAIMSENIYSRLQRALDGLPNGYPETSSGVELRILSRIFTEEEASIASHLGRAEEGLTAIASRLKMQDGETEEILNGLADRGLLWRSKDRGELRYRLAPFVVGIYEAQLGSVDKEFALMMEEYFSGGGAAGIMGAEPAIHRVVPAQKAVKSEWILPYDDVRAIIQGSMSFGLIDCICREQRDQIGRECDFPLRSCLNFSMQERPRGSNSLSRNEALEFFDNVEDIGLVHSVGNYATGIGYVCNCCGCCCGIVRGITDWGIQNSVAKANYVAVIDREACLDCGTCRERCQVDAISEGDGVSVVDGAKCIGCGLCVTGCANDAAKLERKPDAETVDPPKDFDAWERKRLRNRGLA